MQINDPVVIAELTKCHEVYEKALVENDVATLEAAFWDSPYAIRYGVTENLHGADEIRAFRKGRPAINLARQILRLDIMTLGDSAGIVNLEFSRSINGNERLGRQTQFWFRFAEGWKIVSAHVSLLLVPAPQPPAQTSYLEAAAAQIGLKIDPENLTGVKEDLGRIAAIAEFLTQFPLSQSVEAAPVFQP
jgi:hypothetical protein